MLLHNDYYDCYYNNDPTKIIRTDLYDRWDIHFNIDSSLQRGVKSFKQELLNSCELMYDRLRGNSPTLNIFFSGGTDSECLLRCFVELGIPVNPVIIIHHHAPNSKETIIALEVCNELNITPTIINMNLIELYYSHRFYELGMKYQTPRLGMLELLQALEIIGEPAILGDEIKLDRRSTPVNLLTEDEVSKQEWFFYIEEDQDGVFNRYEHLSGIPMITDSFRYTPECWAAMLLTENIKDIVFNERGKATGMTTKNIMMSKEFGVKYREKTNVLVHGPHSSIRNILFRELGARLFPHKIIYIPYLTLLETLGVKYEV